jgi:hypothetical protein
MYCYKRIPVGIGRASGCKVTLSSVLADAVPRPPTLLPCKSLLGRLTAAKTARASGWCRQRQSALLDEAVGPQQAFHRAPPKVR